MLSILIPTYNYECRELVADLRQQASRLNIPFEIIVADDASCEKMKIANRTINDWANCRFIELERNIGRACIRNFLAETAKYEYLLFMDSDAGVKEPDFLSSYLKAADRNHVVCGGLLHPGELPSPSVSLRYTYEKAADCFRMAELRKQHPYDKFTTFSFLIPRELFLSVKFDCTFTKYGHEDTLFGAELKKRNIRIEHIDNPLYHLGLENNEVFLKKTETGIRNLYLEKEKLEGHSRLYTLYDKICRKGLRIPLLLYYKLTYPLLRRNLLSRHPNMRVFALYKLGYLCILDARNNGTRTSR